MPPVVLNHPKRRNPSERHTGRTVEVLDAANQTNYGSWFVLSSRLDPVLSSFFRSTQDYFFGASFVLNVLSWIAYIIHFFQSKNKNTGKIFNLSFRTVAISQFVILTALSLLGFAPFSLPVLIFLGSSILLYPVTFSLKTFYFAGKLFSTEHSNKEIENQKREFFRSKMIESLLVVVIGAIIIGGLIALMGVPGLNAIMMATIGAIGAAVVLAAQIYKIAPLLKKWFCEPKEPPRIDSPPPHHRHHHREKSTIVLTKKIIEESNTDYFQYTVTEGIENIDEFLLEIQAAKEAMRETRGDRSNCGFFSEYHKRDDKVHALSFLEKLAKLADTLPPSAPREKPIKIGHRTFYYVDKNELIKKIDRYIHDRYPGAYQSFFKDVGRVHAHFNALYQYIQDPPLLHSPRSQAEDHPTPMKL